MCLEQRMFTSPVPQSWCASHRVLLFGSEARTMRAVCVMLSPDGRLRTRFEWIHNLTPALTCDSAGRWSITSTGDPNLDPSFRVLRVEPLATTQRRAA